MNACIQKEGRLVTSNWEYRDGIKSKGKMYIVMVCDLYLWVILCIGLLL